MAVAAVGPEFKDLMQSNIRHPDIIFLKKVRKMSKQEIIFCHTKKSKIYLTHRVNSDHMRQEEEISTPTVDSVARRIDC